MNLKNSSVAAMAALALSCTPVGEGGSNQEDGEATQLAALESVAGPVSPLQTASAETSAAVAGFGSDLVVAAPGTDPNALVLFGPSPVDGSQVVVDTLTLPEPVTGVVDVGAHKVVATTNAGTAPRVWVFERGTDGWGAPSELTASISTTGTEFGAAVAAHNDFIVVGEPSNDAGDGRAHLFKRTADGWVADGVLTETGHPNFGVTVTIYDDCAIVSSGTPEASGPVFVYLRTGEQEWTHCGTLFPDEVQPADGFGASLVATSKDVLVGAPGSDLYATDAGAVYFFEENAEGWSQLYTFGLANPVGGERAGYALDSDGEFVLVGAPGSDIGAQDGGAAHLFWWFEDSGKLGEVDQVLPSTASADGAFGSRVALAGGVAAGSGNVDESWYAEFNRPPQVRGDRFETPARTPVAGNVLDNDVELDGEAMTVVMSGSVQNGTLSLERDGSFSYEPNTTFVGDDKFSYFATDGTHPSRTITVTITVVAGDEACGDGICPEDSLCYAESCFRQCDDNASCGTGDACFVGRCASNACEGVVCEEGLVCYGGSCFEQCNGNSCTGSAACFNGRCGTTACDGVQCPVDHVCQGGSCFLSCESADECGAAGCWGGRCASDPCEKIQCAPGQSCVGGTCFEGCSDDDDCVDGEFCYDGRCAVTQCDGIDCRAGETCVGGACFPGCQSDADCAAGSTCEAGACQEPTEPPVEEKKGCSVTGGSPSGLPMLVLAFVAFFRRRRR